MPQLTLWSEEPPARTSRSPDFERALLAHEGTSLSRFFSALSASVRGGWFGRTFLASCRSTADGRLEPFSGAWENSGMGSHTAFLTLSTTTWHSGASACSLSRVLETGDVPRRYYLTPKACAGILRRAEKCGKELPPMLKEALEAGSTPPTAAC